MNFHCYFHSTGWTLRSHCPDKLGCHWWTHC